MSAKTVKKTIVFLCMFCVGIGLTFGQETDLNKKIGDLKNPDMSTRLSAIQGLAQNITAESENALISLLKNEKDAYLRTQIVDTLTAYQSTGALQAVISALNDPNPQVRQTAMIDLGYFGYNEQAAQEISKKLDTEADEAVKLSAINALGQNRTKASVDALGKVMRKEKGGHFRKLAIKRLDKINTREANDEIKKNAADADPEIGKAARDIMKRKKIK